AVRRNGRLIKTLREKRILFFRRRSGFGRWRSLGFLSHNKTTAGYAQGRDDSDSLNIPDHSESPGRDELRQYVIRFPGEPQPLQRKLTRTVRLAIQSHGRFRRRHV